MTEAASVTIVHLSGGTSVWTTVGQIAACLATLAALITLIYARDSASSSRSASNAAQESVKIAAQLREDAKRDRYMAKLEAIGQLVNELYWEASGAEAATADKWKMLRIRLSQEMVGLGEVLPICDELAKSLSAQEVIRRVARARDEVEGELMRIGRGISQ
jgi:hypothetical protein